MGHLTENDPSFLHPKNGRGSILIQALSSPSVSDIDVEVDHLLIIGGAPKGQETIVDQT